MNSIMRFFTTICAAFAASVALAQDAKSTPELIKVREDYVRRQQAALQPVKTWYSQELQRMEQAAIQRRDLEGALALKQEREALALPSVGTPTLTVIKATFGAGNQTADVTKQVQALINNNAIRLKAPWGFGIDPAFGRVKELKIRYSLGGGEKNASFNQKENISLP
jgi:hypothetical protein